MYCEASDCTGEDGKPGWIITPSDMMWPCSKCNKEAHDAYFDKDINVWKAYYEKTYGEKHP